MENNKTDPPEGGPGNVRIFTLFPVQEPFFSLEFFYVGDVLNYF
nr:hypothetical protein [Thermotogaceae bacterium]